MKSVPPMAKRWLKGLLLLGLLVLGIYYVRFFGPVRTIDTLPADANGILLNAFIFTSPFTTLDGVFMYDLDVRRLWRWKFTEGRLSYANLFWYPNRQQLLYDGSLDSETGAGFYWIDKTGLVTEIAPRQGGYGPYSFVPSPDGSQMVFLSENHELSIWDIGSGERRQLTNNELPGSDPSWSPDSNELVFRMSSTEAEPGGIYRIRKDGTKLRPVLESDLAFQPQWSPDGKQIAFAYDDGRKETVASTLWVMNADGSQARELVPVSADTDRVVALTWSPDSNRIALVSTKDGFCGLYIDYQPTCSHTLFLVNVSTGEIDRLTRRWLTVTGITWFH